MSQLNLAEIPRTKNAAGFVADSVRAAILQGKLRSGQALRQEEIAEALGVSKIPVREALVQLQAEGLIELLAGRGAIVSSLTYEQVDEIYTMRLALEPIALARAIPNMKRTDFLDMQHILERIDEETDLSQWTELNWAFHEALYRPSNMSRLIQTVRELHNNVVRLLVHYIDHAQLEKSQAQHFEILAKCRACDVEGAVALLCDHLAEPVDMFVSRVNR